MNISILKDMFDTNLNKIVELEKDIWNEEAQDEAMVRRNAFADKLKSLGINRCGYEGSSFFVYYEDGKIEII